jgi:hypothetical protein
MAYYHATGAVSDPGKIGPYLDEEKKILADLQAEGVGSHTALIANPVAVASFIRQALK